MRIVLYSRPRIIQITFDGSAQALTNERDAAVVVRVRNHQGTTYLSGSGSMPSTKKKQAFNTELHLALVESLGLQHSDVRSIPLQVVRIWHYTFNVIYN